MNNIIFNHINNILFFALHEWHVTLHDWHVTLHEWHVTLYQWYVTQHQWHVTLYESHHFTWMTCHPTWITRHHTRMICHLIRMTCHLTGVTQSRLYGLVRVRNSHIRHSRTGRALLRWGKECGRLWVLLASAVRAPMHSVAWVLTLINF